ncbi:MAG: helix-turn-helix domain-containing protein [Candidatus Hodarchaeota archaeon]
MSSPQRKWTLDGKMEVVLEFLRRCDATTISRSNGISQAQLFDWQDRFFEGGKSALKHGGNQDHDKKRQLERFAGRLTMEKEILKNRAIPAREEMRGLRKVGYPLTVISSALGVCRSTYYERRRDKAFTPP